MTHERLIVLRRPSIAVLRGLQTALILAEEVFADDQSCMTEEEWYEFQAAKRWVARKTEQAMAGAEAQLEDAERLGPGHKAITRP